MQDVLFLAHNCEVKLQITTKNGPSSGKDFAKFNSSCMEKPSCLVECLPREKIPGRFGVAVWLVPVRCVIGGHW